MSTGQSLPRNGMVDCSEIFEGDETKSAVVELTTAGERYEDTGMAAVGFIFASAAGVRFTNA